jgi:glycosyltransferase involved in cell wall biosynthesis
MKVGLVTTSKFHVFDTARQLHKRGLLGRVVSGYPKRLTDREQLPPELITNFPWFTVPLMAMNRVVTDTPFQRELEWNAYQGVDRRAVTTLRDCEVVLGMHCCSLSAGREVQREGGRYWVDRPVVHIAVQDRILREAHDTAGVVYKPIDRRKIDKEVEEYQCSDRVIVPSKIVAQSMVSQGIPGEKIITLPLGADLKLFRSEGSKGEDFELLFAGNLAVQKGIYVLAQAIEDIGDQSIRVTLAGPVLPEGSGAIKRLERACRLEILGKINQDALRRHMTRASVFVLPSVQDGFGVVVPQALACGTPCIVSSMAGSSEMLEHRKSGWIFTSRSSELLAEAILELRNDEDMRRHLADEGRKAILALGGWDAYGSRLADLLTSIPRQFHEGELRLSR